MSKAKITTSSKTDTKKTILSMAMKVASIQGIHGITIGDLAKKIGMSKSGLFAHFKSKDQLQLEVLKIATEHFVEKVLSPAFREQKGLPRIEAIFEYWLEFLKDDSHLPGGSIFISASLELDDRPGFLKDYVEKNQNDLILNIEKAVQMAMDCHHLKSNTNKKEFAWKMYSFILGFHHYRRLLNHPEAEEFIRRAFEDLVQENRSKLSKE